MKRPVFRISAVAVIEEGFELLLQTPAAVLLRFYVGTVPFVLAACFFVLDLGRNPTAAGRGGIWALAMTALYLWMKLWQAGFTSGLRRELGDVSADPRPWRAKLTDAAERLGWEAFAPWMLTLAAVAALPFGWAYAFYQALSSTGDPSRAWSQATAWPRQNHAILGFLSLFALIVAFNTLAIIYTVPYLASSLLGIETRAEFSAGNLTVVTLGATYLLVGPVANATYVLRGFHSDSRASGEDLKGRIRRLSSRAASALVVVGLAGTLLATPSLAAQPADPLPPIDPAALDTELERELAGADYDWSRAPSAAQADAGFLARLMRRGAQGLNALTDWISQLIERLLRQLQEEEPWSSGAPARGLSSPRVLVALGSVLLLAGLIYIVTRRRPAAAPEADPDGSATAVEAALDGDDAAADRLPLEGWLETAHDLVLGGDHRRAARAVYLATLSFMAHSDLVLLARHKSNRDYRDELAVKSRRWPELEPVFSDSIRVVERVWYGRHPAGPEELDRLRGNLDSMRECHEAA